MVFGKKFDPRDRQGTVVIAIGEAERSMEAPIQIFEDYEDPLRLLWHAYFVFEDCAFILNQESSVENLHTGIRKQMRSVLADVGSAAQLIALVEERFTQSIFAVANQLVSTIEGPLEFKYQSELYRRDGKYYDRKLMDNEAPLALIPARQHICQHTAVFALFNHIATKAFRTYEPRSTELMRIGLGIQTLQYFYEQADAFRELGIFRKDQRGVVPNVAIGATCSITEEKMRERMAELERD